MKFLLALFLASPVALWAQADPCVDCQIKCLCTEFIGKENDESKRKVIASEWNDFLGADLEPVFPSARGIHVASIKFDAFGAIYPHDIPTTDIGAQFFDRKRKPIKFDKSTFYRLYRPKWEGDTSVQKFIRTVGLSHQHDFHSDKDYFEFTDAWNKKFLNHKVKEIDDIVSKNDIRRIVFFIHGYNVPHSLAHIQGNVLMDKIFSPGWLDPKTTLFIRVLWPSGNRKANKFETEECDYNNFDGFPKGIATARSFTYVSNRAYLAAVSLRRIVRELKADLPIDIITHSHGSTVGTTLMINTLSKFQSGPLSDLIKQNIRTEPLADKDIRIFLNAPSIPGRATFADVQNSPAELRYRYFVGYNENDKVLKKQKIKGIKRVQPTSRLSSTTLGCNRHGEVEDVKKVFEEKNIADHYSAAPNSTQEEHDFFCYMQQSAFDENLKKFLLER